MAAWLLVERDDGDGFKEVRAYDPSFDTRNMRGLRIFTVIHNASDEPIWDVVVNVSIFVDKDKLPTNSG